MWGDSLARPAHEGLEVMLENLLSPALVHVLWKMGRTGDGFSFVSRS